MTHFYITLAMDIAHPASLSPIPLRREHDKRPLPPGRNPSIRANAWYPESQDFAAGSADLRDLWPYRQITALVPHFWNEPPCLGSTAGSASGTTSTTSIAARSWGWARLDRLRGLRADAILGCGRLVYSKQCRKQVASREIAPLQAGAGQKQR